MSRREIVLLVSRAIAILMFLLALNSLLVNLRIWVLLSQRMPFQSMSGGPRMNQIWTDQIFSAVRILAQFFVAYLFWTCGPTIERLLLPSGSQGSQEGPDESV